MVNRITHLQFDSRTGCDVQLGIGPHPGLAGHVDVPDIFGIIKFFWFESGLLMLFFHDFTGGMPRQGLSVQGECDILEKLLPPSCFIEGFRDFVAPEGEGIGWAFKVDGKAIVKSLDGFVASILKGIPDFDDRIGNPRFEGQLLVDNPDIGHFHWNRIPGSGYR